MDTNLWTVTFQVYRQKGGQAPHWDIFTLQVDPDEYVLDAVERIWAFHDRTLAFRHACHHSTCGACGMRVDGIEKLACITPIRQVARDGATVRVEPLRNFPVVSDLVVEMSQFFQRMEQTGYPTVTPVEQAPVPSIPPVDGIQPTEVAEPALTGTRLNDCIECGLCISACPIASSTPGYLGPAILAAIQFRGLKEHPELTPMADQEDGVWRCHSVFECSEVCPSYVDPAWRIMDLRRQVLKRRMGGLLSRRTKEKEV